MEQREKNMIILIILIFLIFLLNSFIIEKFYLFPGYIFSLYWNIQVVFSIIFFTKYYIWSGYGLLYILLSVFLFYIVSKFVYNSLGKFETIRVKKDIYINYKNDLIFQWGSIIFGFIYILILIKGNGYSLNIFYRPELIFEINKKFALSRYAGGEIYYNKYSQIFLVFLYASPLIGGYSYAWRGNKQRILSILSLSPSLLAVVMTNGKTALIMSLCLWFSAYFVSLLLLEKRIKIKIKSLLKIMSLILMVLIIVYLSFFLRYGEINLNQFLRITDRVLVYSFGQIPSFDNMLYNVNNLKKIDLGLNTFQGFIRMITRIPRESPSYEWLNMEVGGTNVGTFFWGLILDYGILGSLIFTCLFSAFMTYFYAKVKMSKKISVFNISILIAMYSFVLYSFLVSIYIYVSLLFSFFIFMIYLICVHKKINFKKRLD